jgi:hypothetical protein
LFGGALLAAAELAAMQTPVPIPPALRNIYDGYRLDHAGPSPECSAMPITQMSATAGAVESTRGRRP